LSTYRTFRFTPRPLRYAIPAKQMAAIRQSRINPLFQT
jgi:hypothetical protein